MKRHAMIITALGLLGTLSLTAGNRTKVIAHRGFWTAPGSYENTLSALRNAIELGAWGSEFDVWITSDSVAVIHHDPKTLEGDVIQQTPAAKILATVLPNGESIPTLEQYLAAGAKGHTQLVLEIKPHGTPARDSLAVEIATRMVERMKMGRKVDYISFSRTVCDLLVKRNPRARVYYLEGDLSPQQVKQQNYTGIDYGLWIMRDHEQWFDQARSLGLKVNVWTVNDPRDMRYVMDRNAHFITTNYPDRALELRVCLKI